MRNDYNYGQGKTRGEDAYGAMVALVVAMILGLSFFFALILLLWWFV